MERACAALLREGRLDGLRGTDGELWDELSLREEAAAASEEGIGRRLLSAEAEDEADTDPDLPRAGELL